MHVKVSCKHLYTARHEGIETVVNWWRVLKLEGHVDWGVEVKTSESWEAGE